MPDADLMQSLAGAGAGAVGSGAVAWFLFQRLIAQYDARHKEHDDRIAAAVKAFTEGSTATQVKLASVETAVSFIRETAEAVGGVKEVNARQDADLNNLGAKVRQLEDVVRKALEKREGG